MKAPQKKGAIQHYSSWKEVPEHYASKSARATVYQRFIKSIIDLLIVQGATPRKVAIERQVATILRARAAQLLTGPARAVTQR